MDFVVMVWSGRLDWKRRQTNTSNGSYLSSEKCVGCYVQTELFG
jgi:hypothetical protein